VKIIISNRTEAKADAVCREGGETEPKAVLDAGFAGDRARRSSPPARPPHRVREQGRHVSSVDSSSRTHHRASGRPEVLLKEGGSRPVGGEHGAVGRDRTHRRPRARLPALVAPRTHRSLPAALAPAPPRRARAHSPAPRCSPTAPTFLFVKCIAGER
jgi:hypothetical protein